MAPHAIFIAFLDDKIQEELQLGMAFGIELLKLSDKFWMFGKRITKGMRLEIEVAKEKSIPIVYFNERCEKRCPYADT